MRFVLDHNMSPKFAEALRALDRDVIALRENWAQNTPDVDWLRDIGAEGWALVTVDKRIRTRPQEQLVFMQTGVTGFFLGRFWPKMQFWDQATWLIRYWPRFEAFAESLGKPACLAVRQNGKMDFLAP